MPSPDTKSQQSNRYWMAIALTLGVHAGILLVLWMQPLRGTGAQTTQYVEIAVAEWPDVEPLQEHSLESMLSQRMEAQVANLLSDATKSVSAARRSSSAALDEKQMAAEVEADLRAMEQAEFERLGAEKKDFGLEGVPDDGQREQIQTYEEWDSRYDGQVTVAFDVPGRDGLHLDVPGYRCRGGGEVVVKIEVMGDGSVREARVIATKLSPSDGASEPIRMCLTEQALRSAQRSSFRASVDGSVLGTLTYRFIAQQ
tara:strand:- start:1719 stop:2486 length:768 start_codon:yes stop_codon:yes gene_type:complete